MPDNPSEPPATQEPLPHPDLDQPVLLPDDETVPTPITDKGKGLAQIDLDLDGMDVNVTDTNTDTSKIHTLKQGSDAHDRQPLCFSTSHPNTWSQPPSFSGIWAIL
ncbi:hypothetical protein BS17DRAFT_817536 [Gyrodon lividus]|nr:hypothetical protein BS17DRAFT_817536 [Gyrodon lividus]